MMNIITDKQFQKGLVSGLTTAAFLYTLSKYIRRNKGKIEQQIKVQESHLKLTENEPEEIMKEQLVRNYQFFGEESQKKIEQAYVMIFGVGGVGSHVLSCLARSGVREILIVDFDQVTLSSLNRHAFATREDVGRLKVDISAKYLKAIVPNLNLEVFATMVTIENVATFFHNKKAPSFVIDCIDNLDAKAALVAYCVQNKIQVVSSCGAGMKADPTRIQIRDISQSSYDDLARALRIRLKRKYKIHNNVTVVFSNEINERALLPLKEHQQNKVDEYQQFKNYRVRIVPVMGAMPALIAYSISSYVLCQLGSQPFKPQEMDDVKQTTYNRLYQIVLTLGKKLGIRPEELNIDIEDMYIIARETYQWTCLICEKKSLAIELVKWDPEGPITVKNLVPMYGKCIQLHQQIQSSLDLNTKYDQSILDRKSQMDSIIDKIIESKQILFN